MSTGVRLELIIQPKKFLDINELAKMLAFELQGNVKQIPVSGDHLGLMQQS
ncbi:hypothetical protein VAZ01S_024_00330 [Vibrio azureus NBRC 104587]|uniref:Uncharacterized protein n=1 Tax=Vibrio azureus NBRC 104587 TaxID=1219077 RepID=U3A5V0_9VIBR|nr:hypothetical protein VAZ01S_024_00330 [Vibrio azureus NBRC 104587]